MNYHLLPRLLSLLLVWLVLLVWQQAAFHAGDPALPLFLVALSIPVAMAGAEQVFCRRHAFRNEYLIQPSWLYRLLGLEPLVLAVESVKAAGLVLLLLAFALSLDLNGWALLLQDVLILSLLMPRLPGFLVGSVQRLYLYAHARQWAIRLNTGLLWFESMSMLLLSGDSHFRGLSPAEALAFSMRDTPVQSEGVIDAMLRLQAGANGLAHWAVSVIGAGTGTVEPAELMIAWLVIGGVALLFWLTATAVSRALVGTMARPREIWRSRPERRAGGDVFETWWL